MKKMPLPDEVISHINRKSFFVLFNEKNELLGQENPFC